MVWMSIIGSSSGKPAIEVLRASVSANWPSCTMPISALVPPMSKVMSLRLPLSAPDPGAAQHAGGEARKQRQHRLLGHRRRRGDAAIGRHDPELGAEAGSLQRVVEPGDVAAHLGADEG